MKLRKIKKSDYAIIAKKINDRDIYRNTLPIPYPYTITDAQKWIKKVLGEYRTKQTKAFHLAIEADGELVGAIGVHDIIPGHMAELGYWLGRKHWGQGIMTKAIKAMTKECFKRYRLKKIYAYVFTHNEASYRVLVKNGFKKEGLLIQHVKKDGKLKDEYILAKYH